MKITCVGGGPAGLYFAISTKLRDADNEVTVIERDPPGATYGWGVVYWDDLLDSLYSNDPESASLVRAASTLWQEQKIVLRGEQTAYLGGYGFSINRAALLDVLAQRARSLGVRLQHQREVTARSDLADADVVVVADGANSRMRDQFEDRFGTVRETGRNPYIWLGTDKVFDKFTFAFERTSAGWIWFHAYPSNSGLSTCVVECEPDTWRALGFDSLSSEAGVRLLEKLFARPLSGHSLLNLSRGRHARWTRFTQVTNATWVHDNMVLVGDAAHTTHFTIGSGTRLAIIDGIVLAQCLHEHDDPKAALREFDQEGRAEMEPVQAAARTSMSWFEHAHRYLDRDAVAFSYAMAGRHGDHAPWEYPWHRASQLTALRRVLRTCSSGTRWYLACRRGEAGLPVLGRTLVRE